MTWGEWLMAWLFAFVMLGIVIGCWALGDAIGGWGVALNAVPYLLLFVGGGYAMTRS